MVQFLLFILISVYSFFVSQKSDGRDKIHYMAVGASGSFMAVLIVLQTLAPFVPFYTIGCLVANCLIHVFVEADERQEQSRITADVRKEKEIYSQISASLATDYDSIYYVNIETGKFMEISSSGLYKSLQVPTAGEDFYLETRENAGRYAHPDDREFAESMYYKETMKKNLEGRRYFFKTSKKNIPLIISPEDRERMFTVLDKDYLLTALEGRKRFAHQYRMIVHDQPQYTRLTARKSGDGKHIIIGVENVEAEVRKEREHLRVLNVEKELARRDELTGIKNKTAFIELEKSIQENLEKGVDDMQFAIVVCDLNDLKKINDTMGHKAGDDYLVSSAKLLCDIFDHSPVFRIGGDEFAIFLSGDDFALRKQLIDRLHKITLENMGKHEGPVIAVGMAEYDPAGDSDVNEIFDRADHVMYEDKRSLKIYG